MIKVVPPIFQKRDRRVKTKPAPPTPAAAPTLVGATYEVGAAVHLTFDRAIDIEDIDAAEFLVDDGTHVYQGDGSSLDSPTTVSVSLSDVGASGRPGVHLDAGANNDIVAVDGGAMWAGVTNLALPFG